MQRSEHLKFRSALSDLEGALDNEGLLCPEELFRLL